MNETVRNWYREVVPQFPKRRAILEFGSYNVNGHVRDILQCKKWVGIDLAAGPDVDVVADAISYTPDFQPDTIICNSALEHCADPAAMMRNAADILQPGGFIFLCVPTPEFRTHNNQGGKVRQGDTYNLIDCETLNSYLEPFRILEWTEIDNLFLVVAEKLNEE